MHAQVESFDLHSLENICASNSKLTSTAQGSHKHEVRKPEKRKKRENQEFNNDCPTIGQQPQHVELQWPRKQAYSEWVNQQNMVKVDTK